MKKLITTIICFMLSMVAFTINAQNDPIDIGQAVENGSWPSVVYIIIGLGIYFTTRFQIAFTDTAIDFHFKTWLKKNWFNVLCYVVAVVIIVANNITLSPLAAIGLGTMPNLLIDMVQRWLKSIGIGG